MNLLWDSDMTDGHTPAGHSTIRSHIGAEVPAWIGRTFRIVARHRWCLLCHWGGFWPREVSQVFVRCSRLGSDPQEPLPELRENCLGGRQHDRLHPHPDK